MKIHRSLLFFIVSALIRNKFSKFDTWMCLNCPYFNIRVWWCQLWLRKDEFHPSLNADSEVMLSLQGRDLDNYTQDLISRRQLAHNDE